jgi:drug/metabolite transporter (DMT)-like permease
MVFTHFTNKISSRWMNLFKAIVAGLCFFIFVSSFENWQEIDLKSFLLFFGSGFIGLGIGDYFLLRAFSLLGPGRTLMLFGFQPIFLGFMGKFLFDQDMDSSKFFAILFFILCLFTLSFESFKKEKTWGLVGMGFALLGMLLDSSGVLMTRQGFDLNTAISPMQGNFYRCLGAITVYLLMSLFKPMNFIGTLKSLTMKEKTAVTLGSFFGTFLCLGFYLKALQTAHLGSLSGINITATLFSSVFETIFFKKRPTWYLGLAFIFFLIGMKFLVF